MENPLKFYLDAVDTAALEKAKSGDAIMPSSDWPFLPMVAPWVIAGPALAFLPSSSIWFAVVFAAALIGMLVSYLGFASFYTKRVKAYRDEYEIEVRPPSLW